MKLGNNDIKLFSLLKLRYIIAISVAIAVLIIGFSIYEKQSNKEKFYQQLDEYAASLISTIDLSAQNTVISDREMEDLLVSHLLGVARNVARLDSISNLNLNILKIIAEENNIYRINIFNQDGERIISNSNEEPHIKYSPKHSPKDYIQKILDNEETEIIIGLKESRFEQGMRFAVAIRRPFSKKGAIVVNLDAESFIAYRNKTGFGKMIQDIGSSKGIEYIILQNEKEIIAANKNVNTIVNFEKDSFIEEATVDSAIHTREIIFENRRTFEVVKKFIVDNKPMGIFRIGLKMEQLENIEAIMYKRFVIISLILIILAVIVISLITMNQNYKLISGEYERVKTYTGDILENMSQAVITTNKENIITIFNKQAEIILGIKATDANGKNINNCFQNNNKKLFDFSFSKTILRNFELSLQSGKILLISSSLLDTGNVKDYSYTLVVEDITEFKNLENRKIIDDKLIAMGELASSVAHEILNPLNTINMIAQRFQKESDILKTKQDEVINMTSILRSESARVNNIIKQFLKFSKPPKLNIQNVSSDKFINQILSIASVNKDNNKIKISIDKCDKEMISIDEEQMKQVMLNLIQNANEAITDDGNINISYLKVNTKNVFLISDNGEGIDENEINKIFNLYYTTKSKGTGLGLSIVQQIVSQHNGTIDVQSEKNTGTTFIITLP